MFTRFLNDESGATAIEYAMIASGVGLAIAGIMTTFSGDIQSFFTAIGGKLKI